MILKVFLGRNILEMAEVSSMNQSVGIDFFRLWWKCWEQTNIHLSFNSCHPIR